MARSIELRHRASCGFRLFPGALTAGICLVSMFAGTASAAVRTSRHPATKSVPAAARLTGEQKISHALSRLTFGARPGQGAAVEQTGLEAWFQHQLHPESIPDDALTARLAQYPAMRLPQAQLVEHFPTPGMLRQYAGGTLPMPQSGVERAIYADAAWAYEQKRAAKEVAKAADRANPPAEIPSAAIDPTTREAILALPPAGRMQRLLAMTPEQMQGLREALKGQDRQRLLAGLAPEQVETVEALQSPERLITAEILDTRLLRDVYSERQLQAVMTDFWLNHFNVYLHKNQNEPYLLPALERDAVLPHALGRFEDLLAAVAESPAMLVYLDNAQSLGPDSRVAQRGSGKGAKTSTGINENYARELMELHTLGVQGPYTQADVIEVAKCFTGWTVDRPVQGGEFFFNANRHEPGPKTVLGHTVAESGMNEGLQVLHLLATSPATAHFLSLKLAQRFVSDDPPPALVQRMAAAYGKSNGDIAAVLTAMFHAPEFWSASTAHTKVKTPLEFLVSALRATDAEVANPTPLVQALDRLGMPLYGMQTPNGYPALAESWVSSNALLTRMNFALVLSGNRLPGTWVDWPALLGGGVAASAVPDAGTEARLERLLLGQPATAQTRSAALQAANLPDVLGQAEQSFRAVPVSSVREKAEDGRMVDPLRTKAGRRAAPAALPETPLGTVGGLLLGSPEFQRR